MEWCHDRRNCKGSGHARGEESVMKEEVVGNDGHKNVMCEERLVRQG